MASSAGRTILSGFTPYSVGKFVSGNYIRVFVKATSGRVESDSKYKPAGLLAPAKPSSNRA